MFPAVFGEPELGQPMFTDLSAGLQACDVFLALAGENRPHDLPGGVRHLRRV